MITDKDIKKLKQVFATKDDLKSLASKDDLIIFKDEILGEVEKLRQDSVIDTGVHDQVEDHEVRMEQLEKLIGK